MTARALATLPLALLLLHSTPAGAAPPPRRPRGGEIHVNVSAQGSHRDPVAAAFPDGGFVVVWTNDSVIHARFFRADDSPESGELRLSEGPEENLFQAAEGIVDPPGS